jgi:hypothetical protein
MQLTGGKVQDMGKKINHGYGPSGEKEQPENDICCLIKY